MPVLSPQDHQKRLDLYNKGLSDDEIGGILYLAKETVLSWRHKNNLPSHYRKGRLPKELRKVERMNQV